MDFKVSILPFLYYLEITLFMMQKPLQDAYLLRLRIDGNAAIICVRC